MTDDPLVRALKDTYGDDIITAHPVLGALVAELNRLRAVVEAAPHYAYVQMRAERDRLREALDDILIVGSIDSAHLLARRALDGSPDMGGGDVLAMAQAMHYLSTYCLHGNHDDCRLTCKTCEQPCRCPCHQSGEAE